MGKMTIAISDALLYDKLHTLAAEYSVSTDLLVNIAIKRLIDDVELIRKLRAGHVKLE